jgi:hypothetical protein
MLPDDPLEPSILSDAAYAAFGNIVHSFAKFETAMIATLAYISKIELRKVLVIVQQLSYSARRDTLYSYMELFKTDPSLKQEIKDRLDPVEQYVGLRNHIAHSIWTPGVRPNSIRPMTIKIRGGKGIMKGIADDGSEIDYTDQDLVDVSNKIAHLHNDYVRFALYKGMLEYIA